MAAAVFIQPPDLPSARPATGKQAEVSVWKRKQRKKGERKNLYSLSVGFSSGGGASQPAEILAGQRSLDHMGSGDWPVISLLSTVDLSGNGISPSRLRLRVTNSGLLDDSSFALV
jgi:hypothetical protein